MPKKKALRKDIRKSFTGSKGRFFSILCLVALGSFALVGLQVTGPDMRKTGAQYTKQYHTADLAVIGSMGLDAETEDAISQISGAAEIAYGYLKDVVLADTDVSIRIFSETPGISDYELVSGHMPEADDEIALSNDMAEDYAIGDTVSFTEKADTSGNHVLLEHAYTVTGFVNSTELWSHVNLGQSTAGTGELQGYAVVAESAFTCDYTMIARLRFTDTQELDPYSDTYTNLVQAHREELEQLLEDAPEKRLEAVKADPEATISDGRAQIADAKQQLEDAEAKLSDAKQQLDDASAQIEASEAELTQKVSDAQAEIDANEQTLQDAQAEISSGETQLAAAKQQLEQGSQKIQASEAQLNQSKATLQESQTQFAQQQQTYQTNLDAYNAAVSQLSQKQAELDASQAQLEQGKTDYTTGIETGEAQIASLQQALQAQTLSEEEQVALQTQLETATTQLEAAKAAYQQFLDETYTPGMAAVQAGQAAISEQQATLTAAKTELDSAATQLADAKTQLESGAAAIAQGESELQQAKSTLAQSQATYDSKSAQLAAAKTEAAEGSAALEAAKEELATQKAEGEQQIADAKAALSEKQQEYDDGLAEYEEQQAEADEEIPEKEQELDEAQETLDGLALPTFSISTRRELPGSEGYRTYSSISTIVDSLANVFPIFMYFVAALVTLTTMTRFVDEERLQCGTLKALGYEKRDIIRKFTLYGFLSSTIGAGIGILLGHTLMPYIVYHAYHVGFSVPEIELHFYPGITCIALLLAFCSAVVPAFLVASKTLREKPSALLLPKAPSAGSKILLERITPLWNRMSFTHKVTARNLFRYKKRMLMTVFGVCGAVTLLFAGLSVQHSIAGINDRQFGELLRYDLIAAENSNLGDEESEEIQTILQSEEVSETLPIYYAELHQTAGKKQDKQEIRLLVPQDSEALSNFVTLTERKSGDSISLDTTGVVLSERLAELLDAEIGDTVTLLDADNQSYTMPVSGITELYTGHFAFLSADAYTSIFQADYTPNAHLIRLTDSSTDSANQMANRLMQLDGISGIQQNTTMISQINTIVNSLNQIMTVLILVATLLAVVILYNLTNINVMERLRELSTIKVLGFYDKEVTLYIYRETILLTALGILVGYGTGDLFYRYLLATVPPEEVMFNPALGLRAFWVPLVLIGIITFCLGLLMHRKLKQTDMLEALKSVE